MAFTNTEHELYRYVDEHVFISTDKIDEYKERLEKENNLATLAYVL